MSTMKTIPYNSVTTQPQSSMTSQRRTSWNTRIPCHQTRRQWRHVPVSDQHYSTTGIWFRWRERGGGAGDGDANDDVMSRARKQRSEITYMYMSALISFINTGLVAISRLILSTNHQYSLWQPNLESNLKMPVLMYACSTCISTAYSCYTIVKHLITFVCTKSDWRLWNTYTSAIIT